MDICKHMWTNITNKTYKHFLEVLSRRLLWLPPHSSTRSSATAQPPPNSGWDSTGWKIYYLLRKNVTIQKYSGGNSSLTFCHLHPCLGHHLPLPPDLESGPHHHHWLSLPFHRCSPFWKAAESGLLHRCSICRGCRLRRGTLRSLGDRVWGGSEQHHLGLVDLALPPGESLPPSHLQRGDWVWQSTCSTSQRNSSHLAPSTSGAPPTSSGTCSSYQVTPFSPSPSSSPPPDGRVRDNTRGPSGPENQANYPPPRHAHLVLSGRVVGSGEAHSLFVRHPILISKLKDKCVVKDIKSVINHFIRPSRPNLKIYLVKYF